MLKWVVVCVFEVLMYAADMDADDRAPAVGFVGGLVFTTL